MSQVLKGNNAIFINSLIQELRFSGFRALLNLNVDSGRT